MNSRKEKLKKIAKYAIPAAGMVALLNEIKKALSNSENDQYLMDLWSGKIGGGINVDLKDNFEKEMKIMDDHIKSLRGGLKIYKKIHSNPKLLGGKISKRTKTILGSLAPLGIGFALKALGHALGAKTNDLEHDAFHPTDIFNRHDNLYGYKH